MLKQEHVEKIFESKGCRLIGKFVNVKSKLRCICSCGKEFSILFHVFTRGTGLCQDCRKKKFFANFSHSYSYIKSVFEEYGCILLSTAYRGVNSKLEFICRCGNKSVTSYNIFKNKHQCRNCSYRGAGDKQRLTYEYVKSKFENEGCILISDSYDESHSALEYTCSCGETSFTSFNRFASGHRCKSCSVERGSSSRRFSTEYVSKYLKDRGCVYLGDGHVNSKTKFKYICECGNASYTNLNNFKKGRRCKKCKRFSIGEDKIEKFLLKSGVRFKNEFRIDGCKNKLKLPFDFAIFNKSRLIGLIEFDGKQHFEPLDFFGGAKSFNKLKRNDSIKNFYCFANGIPLLRIKYNKIKQLEEIINEFLTEIKKDN